MRAEARYGADRSTIREWIKKSRPAENGTTAIDRQPAVAALWHEQEKRIPALCNRANWLFYTHTVKLNNPTEGQPAVYQLILENSFSGFYLTSFVKELNSTNISLFLHLTINLYRQHKLPDWDEIAVVLINRKSRLSRLAVKGATSLLQNTLNRNNTALQLIEDSAAAPEQKSRQRSENSLTELEYLAYRALVENLQRLNSPPASPLFFIYPLLMENCSIKQLELPDFSSTNPRSADFLHRYLNFELTAAETLKKAHRYQQAAAVIERVLFLSEAASKATLNLSADCSRSKLYSELGDFYYHLSDGIRAAHYFDLSLQAAKKENEPLSVAKAYNMLAVLNYNSGNHQAADSHFKAAIKTLPPNKAGGFHHKIFEYQGKFALIKNEVQKASLYFEKLEKEAERLQDNQVLLEAYYNLASAAFIDGNYEQCILHLDKYQQCASSSPADRYELLYGYDLMVGVYLKVQQYDNALKYLQLQTELAQSYDNQFFMARANLRLGMLLIRNQEYNNAYQLLLRAEHYYAVNRNERELKLVLFHLGELFFYKKQYKKAAGYLISARKASRMADHLFSPARIEHYLGLIALEQQKYSKASLHFQRQLQLAIQHNDDQFATLARESLANLPLN